MQQLVFPPFHHLTGSITHASQAPPAVYVIKPGVQHAWQSAALGLLHSTTPRALSSAERHMANRLYMEVAYHRGHNKCRSVINVPSSRGGHALWPPGRSLVEVRAEEKEWREAGGEVAELRQLVGKYQRGDIEET